MIDCMMLICCICMVLFGVVWLFVFVFGVILQDVLVVVFVFLFVFVVVVLVVKLFMLLFEFVIFVDDFGKIVRFGEQIFLYMFVFVGKYVGNKLICVSCYFDVGCWFDLSLMWVVYLLYLVYCVKNGYVNMFVECLQGCFCYSMNGKVLLVGDLILVVFEIYLYWFVKGVLVGMKLLGQGFLKLLLLVQKVDYVCGVVVYMQYCVLCYGVDGQGQLSGGKLVFLVLWGVCLFNWGVGMGDICNVVGFIKVNMLFGFGGMLIDQEVWDVVIFMDSYECLQDLCFMGFVQDMCVKFYDLFDLMYGCSVNGCVFGVF